MSFTTRTAPSCCAVAKLDGSDLARSRIKRREWETAPGVRPEFLLRQGVDLRMGDRPHPHHSRV